MNYFEYKGVKSSDMGLRIRKKDVFSAPEYDSKFQSIPGRDGDLIMPNGRFPNVTVSYSVYLSAISPLELADKIREIKIWLFTDIQQYNLLTDSYDPDYFRYGVFASKLNIDDEVGRIGVFTVSFSCKPFKYSWNGNDKITITLPTYTVNNIYPFEAKPLYRVYGNGNASLIIGNTGLKEWRFSNMDGYIDIDCEQMNFYKGAALKNHTVTGSGFPDLPPGVSYIISNNLTKIELIPRWRTL